jgi:cytoskeletal protein CcmA (bactofilin family)
LASAARTGRLIGGDMFGNKRRKNAVINTLVGDGTRIEGDLRFEGGCHIDGVVHGNVVADRDPEAFLSISEDGRVEGSVRVPRLSLNGTVQGDVFALERAEIGPTARVVGNVHYELIEMAAGAEINGQLIHTSTQAKVQAPAQAQAQVKVPAKAPMTPSAAGATQPIPRPAVKPQT